MEEVAAETKDLNLAIIQSFLTMLSKYPDTLIARKCGDEAAEEVSKMAAEVLDAGGALTEEGKKRITELDTHLRSDGNNLNPGTTADITAAGLFLLILNSGKTEEKGNTQWI
jgi:triphosphoribosyl-dephospho-CoA synthase